MEQQKSYYNCSVDGCSNSTLNSELSFFRLPVISERRSEWLTLINREDLIDSTSPRARVCEAHFSPNSIAINSRRKQLKRNATPQLLLPSPSIFSNKETQTIVETADVNVQCNHVYQRHVQIQTPIHLSKDATRINKLLREVQKYRNRLKIANNKQSDATTFHKLCDKFLTPNLASIVKQQTKIKFSGSGNRFSTDYKMFCLNLYHVSPQAYKLLKDILCLPSKQTLTKMHIPITTKIDSHLIDVLKTRAQYMSDMDRNCTLVVGVINLKMNLFYDIKEDRIYGFHEVNGVQSPEPAKYALVAMIHGLFEDYKQPVGFALLAECKNNPSLTDWIDKLISKLYSVGFYVRSLVSDMGYEFFNCAKNRLVSVESPYFFVGDRKIYCIFDPPHLIKLVRNNLINYDFHFDNNVAKWNHILQFYEMDKSRRLRLAPKLTDSHIKPTNTEKMNVKYAVQVFSATVAAGLSTYKDFGIIEDSSEGTIQIIEIMNHLFDFLNTSSQNGSTYQKAFCGEDYQIIFINDMLRFFASLKLINPNNGQNCTSRVKFIEGVQITLKSLLMLFEDLRNEGICYLPPRRLNQDCLEHFFGQIRVKNGKVTERKLISAIRKSFFLNMLKFPKSGKCTNALTTLDIQNVYASVSDECDKKDNESCVPNYVISTSDYNSLDIPDNNALVYVSGYLLRKCFDHHKDCHELKAYLIGENNAQNYSQGTFVGYKDYCQDDNQTLLTVPLSFLEFVGSMEERFCNFFEQNHISCEILKSLLHEVQTLTFSLPCNCFPLGYCKKLYMRMRIFYCLKRNNRGFRQFRNRSKFFSVTKLQ